MSTSGGSGVIDQQWGPLNQSLIGWSQDPSYVQASEPLSLGSIVGCQIEVAQAALCTGCWFPMAGAGTLLTAGQNFCGIYNAAGNLLATTADLTALWGGTNQQAIPWVTPVQLPAGVYSFAALCNGTGVAPSFLRSQGGNIVTTAGQTAVPFRFFFAGGPAGPLPAVLPGTARRAGSVFAALY